MGARVEEIMRDLAAAIREEVGGLPTGVATLGEEIERARASANMSLQDVADRADLTKSHVWELAKGRSRNPTIAAVAALSKALGVPFLRLAQAALNSSSHSPSVGPMEGREPQVQAAISLSCGSAEASEIAGASLGLYTLSSDAEGRLQIADAHYGSVVATFAANLTDEERVHIVKALNVSTASGTQPPPVHDHPISSPKKTRDGGKG